ncbi:hypothetical protein CDG79_28430 [Nostoc sp. 'Peltigera membranacea cyanobiont' 232]|nr:hypothetical protein CDG79_28430 [Nostoc sp. 'Peltigera membranacea cyanobiont' 232]
MAGRLRTESTHAAPLFFIGSSPSQAAKIISHDYPAAGVMISVNALRHRVSDFEVADWIGDSGAFTEISTYGCYRYPVEEYLGQICRWVKCGNLLIAVSQDWMCEPFIFKRTGLNVETHQRLTIERYDQIFSRNPPVAIMPVLQGYRSSDYISHLQQYGERLPLRAWVGVGSVCRRNGNRDEVADILRAIKLIRPDLRLHGFGLKILALENTEVRELLHSCDSMAWSYPRRFQSVPQEEIPMAHNYQQKINAAVNDSVQKRVPKTAGAGNGQGRKPKWKSSTQSVRLPKKYIPQIIQLAKQWEEQDK